MNHCIEIENLQDAVPPFRGYKTALRRAVSATLEEMRVDRRAQVSISLVSSEEIRRLNREFRETDRETDVLSFPLWEKEEEWEADGGVVPLGDIIVCPQVIRRQSEEFGTTYRQELCLMVIHSTLHLLGWDHMEEEEKKKMYALQEKILSSLKEGEIQTEAKRKTE